MAPLFAALSQCIWACLKRVIWRDHNDRRRQPQIKFDATNLQMQKLKRFILLRCTIPNSTTNPHPHPHMCLCARVCLLCVLGNLMQLFYLKYGIPLQCPHKTHTCVCVLLLLEGASVSFVCMCVCVCVCVRVLNSS